MSENVRTLQNNEGRFQDSGDHSGRSEQISQEVEEPGHTHSERKRKPGQGRGTALTVSGCDRANGDKGSSKNYYVSERFKSNGEPAVR